MKSTLPGIALLTALGFAGWRFGQKQAVPGVESPPPAGAARTLPPTAPPAAHRADHSRDWREIMDGTDPGTRIKQLAGLLRTWAAESPRDAWAALLRDGDELGGELEPRLAGLAGTIFLHYAAKHGWENARRTAASAPEIWQEQIGRSLGVLHATDSADPKALVPSLTDSPAALRTGILSQVLAQTNGPALPAKSDWEAWLVHLETNGWSKEEQESMTKSVSSSALATDPKPAADWLAGIPATPGQKEERLNSIVWQWAQGQSAANACGAWLDTQPLGPEADRALESFSQIILPDDPESAVAWAQRIHDPTRREAVAGNIFRQWRLRAPMEAAAAADRLGVKVDRF